MATAAQKIYRRMNDEFTDSISAAFEEKFKVTVETQWDIFAMRLVTTRRDENPLTKEQYEFIETFSAGYRAAMEQVGVAA